ncbi:BTAD domain-containing putative transcriptional regulator [Streptomyces sp. NPDC006510]|uniref:AfsR/SARP family transcriptional regulator n=1 Tax=Streptomyces sp. NPDC006510 TaxID=3155600 RepID=UPI0033A38256
MPFAVPPTPAVSSWPPAEGIRFGVLGAVRLWRDSEALPAGSPQQRAVLAALLLRDGHRATAAELIDAVWGDDPPAQALAAVRTYASRLRKVLDSDVFVSEGDGYALRLAPDAVDVQVAQDLAANAERARSRGDHRQARDLLNGALGLWDGEALASVPGPYAENQRTRLEEWRLQLIETRLEADLELGAHAEAVSELKGLVAAHPFRERLRELLMLALYRSRRQAEALAVYADTRRLLADELGVAPRSELSLLHQRILQADESLLAPSQSRPTERPAAILRPVQLPATVPDFTGRASLVRELGDRLAAAEGSVMAVSALAGVGGVGKTTLAVHVAHQARQHFPDGQLYVDLQGAGVRATEPESVLGKFLRDLGTPDPAIPDTLGERAALFRSVLDGRRVLVLLDNARDTAQIRPLLPGSEGCAALVTSRARMVGLADAQLVDLDVMSPDEALQLFTRIVGEERINSEREAALDVVAACGFLPLAIRIAASRLAARRTWTVSVLAAKLADERRRLDELQAGDLAVKATFELGYGQLEPAQARAFRLLGLADGPDISLAAAAALLGLEPHTAEDLLEALVDTSFLESAAPGRYRYLSLVRLYARACAERDEHPASARESALSRLLDFYLATASAVYAVERPGDRLLMHLAPTACPGLTFRDGREALDWLYAEAGCLLACARQSSAEALLGRAVDLLWVARDLCESGSDSVQYESTAAALHEAAVALGDPRTAGRAALVLAEAHSLVGRHDETAQAAERALREAETCADTPVRCRAVNLLGLVALYRSRNAEAESYFLRALEEFRADRDGPGEASVLCNLSRVELALGKLSEALTLAERGVAMYDGLGATLRGANARYTLGLAFTRAGRYAEAEEALDAAGAVFKEHRQHLWQGFTHLRLAEVDLAAQRPQRAAAHAEQALAGIGTSGGEWRRGNVLTVLGRALHAMDQTDRARACWQEALNIYEELGSAESADLRSLLDDTMVSSARKPG